MLTFLTLATVTVTATFFLPAECSFPFTQPAPMVPSLPKVCKVENTLIPADESMTMIGPKNIIYTVYHCNGDNGEVTSNEYKCTFGKFFSSDTNSIADCDDLYVDCTNDTASDCSSRANKADCYTDPKFMKTNCCKTCEDYKVKCTDTKESGTFCEWWASKHECKRNPLWMLPNCCSSCKGKEF